MPPAAMTDWERSEGKGDISVTWTPCRAHRTAHAMPDMPLPLLNTCFMGPTSLQEHGQLALHNGEHRYGEHHGAHGDGDPIQPHLPLPRRKPSQ